MALDPSNTARAWLDYSVAGKQHTLQVRCAEGTTDGDLVENVSAFIEAVESQLYPSTVTGFRRADKDSNISFDVAWTGVASWGSGVPQPAETANYFDFVGRDPNGFRVRVAMFGAKFVTSGGDYRVSVGEDAFVAAGLASLVSDASVFLTISGDQPIWKQYANCGVNAYWRNKIR